jgi:hypothetical protein
MTRSGPTGGDDEEKRADLLQRFVGTVHQRDVLRLVARYVPGYVAAQFASRCRSAFSNPVYFRETSRRRLASSVTVVPRAHCVRVCVCVCV